MYLMQAPDLLPCGCGFMAQYVEVGDHDELYKPLCPTCAGGNREYKASLDATPLPPYLRQLLMLARGNTMVAAALEIYRARQKTIFDTLTMLVDGLIGADTRRGHLASQRPRTFTVSPAFETAQNEQGIYRNVAIEKACQNFGREECQRVETEIQALTDQGYKTDEIIIVTFDAPGVKPKVMLKRNLPRRWEDFQQPAIVDQYMQVIDAEFFDFAAAMEGLPKTGSFERDTEATMDKRNALYRLEAEIYSLRQRNPNAPIVIVQPIGDRELFDAQAMLAGQVQSFKRGLTMTLTGRL